jgi:GNAT superfamily N-acetyltransferase
MPALEWIIEDSPAKTDVERLAEAVTAHGRALAKGDALPVACFVRSGTDIVAGAYGRTEFKRLFVLYLWVDAPLRGRGLGSRLLQELEARAILRGCIDSLIETLSDEVASLYLRRGYAPLATIPNYVGPFTRHILLKSLSVPRGD